MLGLKLSHVSKRGPRTPIHNSENKKIPHSRWCHQMDTFSALLAICEGNPPVTGGSHHKGQWRGALVGFYLCLNKRLSKHSRPRWFETPSYSLWRRCNARQIPRIMHAVHALLCFVVVGYRPMATENWVNIGSGNGLLSEGTKPLPEPMLTYHE